VRRWIVASVRHRGESHLSRVLRDRNRARFDPEETRKQVLDATGWCEAEEFPWAKTDDKGNLIPGTDTPERLQVWLDSRLDDNYDLLGQWGTYDSTEYAPGFELMSSLPEEEVKRLSMVQTDRGGPGSSVPCVATGASMEELNATMAAHGLPFLFVADEDDEGS
jgi:hypothetical protein